MTGSKPRNREPVNTAHGQGSKERSRSLGWFGIDFVSPDFVVSPEPDRIGIEWEGKVNPNMTFSEYGSAGGIYG
jgi:hypothetical protein